MPKYTKTTITQLSANEQAALDQINKNFDDIQTAIADTVSRSGTIPSHMTNDLDMNGKRIINVPTPTTDLDLVRRKDVVDDIATVQSLVNTTTNAAAQTLQAAQAVQEIMQDQNVGLVADDLGLGENSNIRKCGESKTNIDTVAANISSVNDVADNISNVAYVASSMVEVNVVSENINNVNTLAQNAESVVTNARNISDISYVADNMSDINNVSDNMSSINNCSSNMAAIIDAPNQASSAAQSAQTATQAALSITNGWDLLDFKWKDRTIIGQNWLLSDSNWKDGTDYSDVYNHLVNDYTNGSKLYGWGDFANWVGTISSTPSVGDSVYAGIPSAIVGTVTAVSGSSITVDGTTYRRYSSVDGGFFDKIGSYTIRYVLAADGHQICLPDQEAVAQNIYDESGTCWFYILDTTNQRFKLPMVSHHGQVVERENNTNQWSVVYEDGWCEQGGYLEPTAATTTITLLKNYLSADYTITASTSYTNNNNLNCPCVAVAKNASGFSMHVSNLNYHPYWRTCGYVTQSRTNSPYKYLYFYVAQNA